MVQAQSTHFFRQLFLCYTYCSILNVYFSGVSTFTAMEACQYEILSTQLSEFRDQVASLVVPNDLINTDER